jgi:UDP-glucuronate decarboxylase
MAILVTGGAGFIGSHLCETLLTDGHEVICLDNLSSGDPTNVAHLRSAERFVFLDGDVRDPLEQTVDRVSRTSVDRIYHLASRASPTDFEDHALDIAWTSAKGTYNALSFAADVDARIIVVSTSEVYGDPEVHPQPETYEGNVDPRGPRAPYDEGNRFAETLAVAFRDEHGVDVRTARPFNTYGPRMHPDDGRVVPTFVSQALRGEDLTVHGDGSQTRSFLYVSDTIRGLVSLMKTDGIGGTVVNIGSEQEWTVLELAELVIDVVGAEVGMTFEPRPEDDPERRQADASRARRLFDWKPSVGLEPGLARTVDAMQDRMHQ